MTLKRKINTVRRWTIAKKFNAFGEYVQLSTSHCFNYRRAMSCPPTSRPFHVVRTAHDVTGTIGHNRSRSKGDRQPPRGRPVVFRRLLLLADRTVGPSAGDVIVDGIRGAGKVDCSELARVARPFPYISAGRGRTQAHFIGSLTVRRRHHRTRDAHESITTAATMIGVKVSRTPAAVGVCATREYGPGLAANRRFGGTAY